jgi:hypothetical protein
VIQTPGGAAFLPGLEQTTFPYASPVGTDVVGKSDLVIAVGTEIGEPIHYGVGRHWAKGNSDRKWIYVEKNPQSIGVNRRIDAPLVGDLRDVVPQLVAALARIEVAAPRGLAEWVAAHEEFRTRSLASVSKRSSPIHPARFAVEATRVLPKDTVLVRDGGAVNIFTWAYSQLAPRDVLWCQNFGHLGTGLPHAIGAQLAVGDGRRVVLMSGDSSFLFHISELETAVRKKAAHRRDRRLRLCLGPRNLRLQGHVRARFAGNRGPLGRAAPPRQNRRRVRSSRRIRIPRRRRRAGRRAGPCQRQTGGRARRDRRCRERHGSARLEEFASWYGDAGY